MNNMPLVSIIVPCYNHENYVQECIQSIIEQDYQNIELIIIDDGSKDNSVQKIKEMHALCEQRFTCFEFRHRSNKGLCATLNEALEWCQGKYVSIIASDDMMLAKKTSIQVQYLEANSNISSISTNMQIIDDKNTVIEITNRPTQEFTFSEVLLGNRFFAPSQMHRLSTLKELGGYNERCKTEDWYMWLKLLQYGHRIVFLDTVTTKYRRHETNSTRHELQVIEYEIDTLSFYKDQPEYKKCIRNILLRKNKLLNYSKNKPKYYFHKYMIKLKYKFNQLQ